MNINKSKYDKKNFINSFFFDSNIINPYDKKKYEPYNSENKKENIFNTSPFTKKFYLKKKYEDLKFIQRSKEKEKEKEKEKKIFHNNKRYNISKYKIINNSNLENYNNLYKAMLANNNMNQSSPKLGGCRSSKNKKILLNFSFLSKNKEKININKNNININTNKEDQYRKYDYIVIKLRRKFHGNILFTEKYKKELINSQKIIFNYNKYKNYYKNNEKNLIEKKCKFTNEMLKSCLSERNIKKYNINNILY